MRGLSAMPEVHGVTRSLNFYSRPAQLATRANVCTQSYAAPVCQAIVSILSYGGAAVVTVQQSCRSYALLLRARTAACLAVRSGHYASLETLKPLPASAMATVSSLSLETYLQLRQALTKGQPAVKPVQPFEEAFYKPNDLKQVLALHGIPFSSRAGRSELLQALVGHELVSLIHQSPPPSSSPAHLHTTHDQQHEQQQEQQQQQQPIITSQDLVSLGWASSSSMQDLQTAFHNASVLFVPSVERPCHTAAQPAQVGHSGLQQSLLQDQAPIMDMPPLHQQQPSQQQQQTVQREQQSCGRGGLDVAAHSTSSRAVAPNVAVPNICAAHPPAAPAMLMPQPAQQAAPAAASLDAPPASSAAPPTAAAAAAAAAPPVTGSDPRDALLAQLLQQQAATQQLLAQLLPTNPAASTQPTGQTRTAAAATGRLEHDDRGCLPAAVVAGAVCLQPPSRPCPGVATATPGNQLQQVPPLQHQAVGLTRQDAAFVNEEEAELPLPASASPLQAWLHQQILLLVEAGAVPCRQPLDCRDGSQHPAGAAAAAAGSAPVVTWPPAGEENGGSSAGGPPLLLGRRVAFALLEELEVLGPKGLKLKLPAGLYQSRAVRYIGPACLPDLCETNCPGGHHFFKAKVLPIEAQLSSGAGPVVAAAGGRPVELQLDLAHRHRAHSWAELLQLDEPALQDAWVLLQQAADVPRDCWAGGKRGAEGLLGGAAPAGLAAAGSSASPKRNRQQ